jgi:cobalt/nickel transport system permease protein
MRLAWWGLGAAPWLAFVALAANVPLFLLLRRACVALPFVLSAASLALFQPHGALLFAALVIKSLLSVLALQLLATTTPISELLAAARRAHVPEILLGTVGLLHRYLFLFVDESTRMTRARASRTLRASRAGEWRARGSSLGILFLRTVSRAERVHAAMRARGAP